MATHQERFLQIFQDSSFTLTSENYRIFKFNYQKDYNLKGKEFQVVLKKFFSEYPEFYFFEFLDYAESYLSKRKEQGKVIDEEFIDNLLGFIAKNENNQDMLSKTHAVYELICINYESKGENI